MSKCLNRETYSSIERRVYLEYVDKVKSLYPRDINKRFEYAKEIMPGQIYMNYVIDELQDATMAAAYGYGDAKKINNITFTSEQVETLLRAMGFMIERMHDGLPEHNYDYIKTKSSSFFRILREQVKDNIDLFDED
jgi:hypothetical protein